MTGAGPRALDDEHHHAAGDERRRKDRRALYSTLLTKPDSSAPATSAGTARPR